MADDSEEAEEGAETVPDPFVVNHHGDWPAPEIFVINDGA